MPSLGGGAEKTVAVFDVGPDVCRALLSLYGKPKKQMDAKPSLTGETPAAVPPAPTPPAPSNRVSARHSARAMA
jgi:hypothetical protein